MGRKITMKRSWLKLISKSRPFGVKSYLLSQIKGNIHWQGILWRALVYDVQRDFGGKAKHRAALNQQF